MSQSWLPVAGLSLFLLGCGGGGGASVTDPASVETETAVPTDQLKQTLQEIANTGEAGSAAMGLRPGMEAFAKENPGKGAALLKDLTQLEASTNPAEVKTLAKKIADQL